MSDAHDEAAKAIARHYVSEWDGDEEDVYANMKADIAAALRKAAADERSEIVTMVEQWADNAYPTQRDRDDNGYRVSLAICDEIAARAKGGALSVQASGVHDCAEGHSKSCTCSYCEVGR